MGKIQYHVCGSCRREFYSDEEYFGHSCRSGSGKPNGDPRGMIGKAMASGMFKDITGDDAKARELMAGISSGKMGVEAAEAVSILEEHASTDIRLQAAQEMRRMKRELAAAGIPCNTLTEEQTREEYGQYIKGAEKAAGGKAANPKDGKPKAASRKKARGKTS